MNLPNRFLVVQQFKDKYGLPDNSDDNARRAWIYKVAQTLAALYPGEGWGTKSSSPTNPQTADVVCIQTPTWFEGADTLNGSTGDIQWNWVDLRGQNFISVPPYNWLQEIPHADTPQHEDVPSEPGPSLIQLFQDIQERLKVIESKVSALQAPVYEGAASIPFLGTARFTMTPKK